MKEEIYNAEFHHEELTQSAIRFFEEKIENRHYAFFVICSLVTGLKYKNLINLTLGELENNIFENNILVEKLYSINRYIEFLIKEEGKTKDDLIFLSRKGTPYSNQQINRLLKKQYENFDGNITTRELRRSYFVHLWSKKKKQKDKEILLKSLTKRIGHSNRYITLEYLGSKRIVTYKTDEEVENKRLTLNGMAKELRVAEEEIIRLKNIIAKQNKKIDRMR